MDYKKDPRRLKAMHHRKPVDIMNLRDVITEVGRETEFSRKDVKLVIDTFIKKMETSILDNKVIKIPGIGAIYPTVKRARPGVNLNGGKGTEKIIIPAMWVLKLQPSAPMVIKLKKIKVSKEDIDNLYYKD